MLNTKQNTTKMALLLANAVPLFGVFFFDWSIQDIIYLYWVETVIIGLYTAMKIIFTKGVAVDFTNNEKARKEYTEYMRNVGEEKFKKQLTLLKMFLVPFFLVHYGGFVTGHRFFLNVFFLSETHSLFASGMIMAVLSLCVSHGISYYKNFIQKGEYLEKNPMVLMFEPYKRIVFMHVFIIASSFLFILFELYSPFIAVFFVGLKTYIDLWSHKREHTFSAEENKAAVV